MLELRHLRSLLAIRDSGSLAAAAPRVHLTQSALSHQIRGLEDYFGVPLFFRNQRPLRPTPAGERLIRLAEEILPAVSAAEEALRQAARGSRGRLHMAIECHSCFQWLMPTLERYRREWPQVELDFSLGFSFHPLPALYRGDIDLVVTADPEEDYGGLRFTPLFRYEVQLLVPRAHRLAERPFIEPADLAGETLISYPVCRSKLDVFSRFLTPAGIEPAAVRTSELTALIVQLVASGRGWRRCPTGRRPNSCRAAAWRHCRSARTACGARSTPPPARRMPSCHTCRPSLPAPAPPRPPPSTASSRSPPSAAPAARGSLPNRATAYILYFVLHAAPHIVPHEGNPVKTRDCRATVRRFSRTSPNTSQDVSRNLASRFPA